LFASSGMKRLAIGPIDDRPEWQGHDTDWPNGGRLTDIITKDRTFDWTEIDNVVQA
jgi:thiosulfate dehydrogenase